jgi:hypothetical protein
MRAPVEPAALMAVVYLLAGSPKPDRYQLRSHTMGVPQRGGRKDSLGVGNPKIKA